MTSVGHKDVIASIYIDVAGMDATKLKSKLLRYLEHCMLPQTSKQAINDTNLLPFLRRVHSDIICNDYKKDRISNRYHRYPFLNDHVRIVSALINQKLQSDFGEFAIELIWLIFDFSIGFDTLDTAYVARVFGPNVDSKPVGCQWFGNRIFTVLNTQWNAARITDDNCDRLLLSSKLKTFTIAVRAKISDIHSGAHYGSLLAVEHTGLGINGNTANSLYMCDNEWHSIVFRWNYERRKVDLTVDSMDKNRLIETSDQNWDNAGDGFESFYFGCHVSPGFGNVYKRTKGEILDARIYDFAIDDMQLKYLLFSYDQLYPN